MNILCVSFKETSTKRENLTREIVNLANAKSKFSLLILPGNMTSKLRIINDEEWASKISDEFGVGVFYETASNGKTKGNYYTFYSSSVVKNTGVQVFATSEKVDANEELYKTLIGEIKTGHRTTEYNGVRFGVIICGENNILKNLQKDKKEPNRVVWRYCDNPPEEWNATVIVNPSHNTMGNWGKLNKRFEFLSRKYGYAIYLTNSSGKKFGRSSLKIFKKGEEIKNGEFPDFMTEDGNAIGCLLDIPSKTKNGDRPI